MSCHVPIHVTFYCYYYCTQSQSEKKVTLWKHFQTFEYKKYLLQNAGSEFPLGQQICIRITQVLKNKTKTSEGISAKYHLTVHEIWMNFCALGEKPVWSLMHQTELHLKQSFIKSWYNPVDTRLMIIKIKLCCGVDISVLLGSKNGPSHYKNVFCS